MATNHYFQAGIPGGRSSEQLLVEDLIIECLQIYGFDAYYLPRKAINRDLVLNEDPLNQYSFYFPIEMYIKNVNGFEGEGDLLSKFGVEIKDSATFVVSRRRWDLMIAKEGKSTLVNRPAEGDVIYFPLTKSYFEINRVENQSPFYQVGKLYTWELQCELMSYSSETFNTGVTEIDSIVEKSTNLLDYQLKLDGYEGSILLEYETPSSVILESYNIELNDAASQNDVFTNNIDVLDFTETNPFGEVI